MSPPIELRSDNAAGVAPEILAALAAANDGSALAYGADAVTEQLHAVVREVFEHPTARVFPVTSGTAANALSLSAMTPPWGAVLCHHTAHIINSEGGATSLLSGGAVMQGVGGERFRIDADQLRATLAETWWNDPHQSQPAVLSFTQPTDRGTIYPVAQIGELAGIARARGLKVHLDGARLANAIVALGCSPAALTWQAGVDTVSLGATKNGALSAEAIVTFDEAVAEQLVYRTKRSGHVTSKMRYQSAQLIAYLTDALWLRLAANSNARMAELAAGLAELPGIELVNQPDVNMAFVRMAGEVSAKLRDDGLLFYADWPGMVRFVTSWQTTPDDVREVLVRVAAALAP